ncbi:hypothetical protein HaLaN_26089 [Haematococcus lacustris]|uniref:Uncharacterized protein n=1 Tax=Haematococcus lacustris TaxID=44745 RepID=A0A6A0A5E7_HAELA|nr:hypothetical protein HaLaN_26089 [Haematococcus lacustris]
MFPVVAASGHYWSGSNGGPNDDDGDINNESEPEFDIVRWKRFYHWNRKKPQALLATALRQPQVLIDGPAPVPPAKAAGPGQATASGHHLAARPATGPTAIDTCAAGAVGGAA